MHTSRSLDNTGLYSGVLGSPCYMDLICSEPRLAMLTKFTTVTSIEYQPLCTCTFG